MNTPKLRFEEFNGEWRAKRFYDCVEINAKLVDPKEEQYFNLPHIGPGNIEKFTGQLLNYELVKNENLISGKYEFENQDVIYSKIRPELNKVAFPEFKGLCSADTYPIRTIKGVMDPYFLFQQLLSYKFIKYSISVSMRTGMPKINRNELAGFTFTIPGFLEQKKIGEFLKLINRRINKQQEKIEKLEELKKGMMQKVFSQELQFKDENGFDFGKWESIEFGDVVEKLIGGGTPSRKVEEYYQGDIPWVTVKDLKTNKYVTGALEHITELGLERSSSKIVDPGDLIIPTRMAVGRILIATEKVAINQDLKGCKLKSQYDTEFIYYLYYSKSEAIERLGSGSTVSGINIDQLNKIKIHVPVFAEQLKIAGFLRKLDEKITLEKDKLTVLEVQKKGFLQGMFV